MHMKKIKKIVKNKWNDLYVEKKIPKEKMDEIYKFFCCFDGYRTAFACAEVTGVDEKLCRMAEQYLQRHRKIGAYVFEKDAPPQKYMVQYITKKFPTINEDTRILEIGPGDHPLFDEKRFVNWIRLDKGYVKTNYGGIIKFHEYAWGKGKYQHLYEGSWESLSSDCEKIPCKEEFDLVCGSHSFEHTAQPITALREAAKMLKKGGQLVLFVLQLRYKYLNHSFLKRSHLR